MEQSTRSRRRDSPATVAIYLGIIAICLVAWHYFASSRGQVSPPEQVLLTVLQPLQTGMSRLWRAVSNEWDAARDWRHLVRENRSLRRQISDLESQNQRLLHYLEENQRLRKMLDLMPGIAARRIAAEVVAIESQRGARRIWINRGSRDGVRSDDPVISESGLVGRVLRCDGYRSYVLLLTDPEGGVGARCVRSGATGILKGLGEDRCRLEYLDQTADVRVGDVLITSGLGGVYPRGLHIGEIVDVRKDIRRPSQFADVEPSAALTRLDQVFILRVDDRERGAGD